VAKSENSDKSTRCLEFPLMNASNPLQFEVFSLRGG
jgi:hypothetical protein